MNTFFYICVCVCVYVSILQRRKVNEFDFITRSTIKKLQTAIIQSAYDTKLSSIIK